MKSVPKVTLALAAACMLVACTALRVAYENADTYLHWRSGSYLDLDRKESQELAERIDAFFTWHRAQELPQYARIADEAAQRLDDGLSREDLVWGYDSLVAHARQSLRVAAGRIAPLLDGLTPQQVAHLEKGFAEDNRKFARENLRGSEKERRKRRAKKVEERLEDWVGNLTHAQVERVRQYSERAPLYDELRDRDRKRLQAEVLEMVRQRAAQQRLADLAAHWDRGRDPAYAAASEKARQEYFALLLDLDRTLTREQRVRAIANLERYAEDFKVLASRKRTTHASQ
ncbi:MAG: hypothetical protein EPO20_19460 [Betaproteobacteria bacterium]|nr:MAG: hypothetical protein EPO20_19460 [Betaproteobacteria bacterium]